jgi:hypothetical protein
MRKPIHGNAIYAFSKNQKGITIVNGVEMLQGHVDCRLCRIR